MLIDFNHVLKFSSSYCSFLSSHLLFPLFELLLARHFPHYWPLFPPHFPAFHTKSEGFISPPFNLPLFRFSPRPDPDSSHNRRLQSSLSSLGTEVLFRFPGKFWSVYPYHCTQSFRCFAGVATLSLVIYFSFKKGSPMIFKLF